MNGGNACEAPLQELQECDLTVDCELSGWTEWDGCDKTCEGGQQQRHRQVVKNPHLGGNACPTDLMETRGCNQEPCNKVDCAVSDWGAWGPCSATCGSGQRGRSRRIVQQPHNGGTGCGLDLSQLEICSMAPCEYVDCLWSDWADWSDCSSPCEGGQRTRTRHIDRQPGKGGKPCVPLSKEEVGICNTQKCHEEACIDGAWGEWAEWEKCSASCNGGVTWRTREVETEANHCGTPVTGPSRVYAACNSEISCIESVDCVFGDWGAWSGCTSSCDGVKRRSRAIAVHGRGKGEFCLGPLKETGPCNPSPGEPKPQACLGGPVINCQMGEWSEWGRCSASCSGGSQARDREVLKHPANGGIHCEEVLREVRGCNRAPCSRGCEPQDCRWDDWGEWSACDKCGGQRKRFRHISMEAQCGGNACEALASEETTNCTRQCHEPAYCMWGDWEGWSACSASCGSGEKTRTRHLTIAPEQPMRFLQDFDLSELDEALLEDKVHVLRMENTGLRTRRLQEVTVAFIGGGVTLVAGLALLRVFARVKQSSWTDQRFARVPFEGQD